MIKGLGGPDLRATAGHIDLNKQSTDSTPFIGASFDGGELDVFRAIFENATVGIFQTAPAGHYIQVNPALARMYGYDSPGQMMAAITDIGKSLYLDERSRSDFIVTLERDGFVKDFECKVRRADGRVIWISENARIVKDENGKPLYYEGFVSEITKRKQLEERLMVFAEELEIRVEQRTQQLEMEIERRRLSERSLADALDQAKGAAIAMEKFIAGVSHELRTPLNAIIGFSELMKSEVLGEMTNDDYKNYTNMINDSGNHLLTLINDILDISKINSGEFILERDYINLHDIIESSLEMMCSQAQTTGIKIKSAFHNADPIIRADGRRIKQVVLNLLSNAIKFTPSGGSISIETKVFDNETVTTTISDNGIGMAPEEIPKALSEFGQLSTDIDNIQTAPQGTGLGLPISKKLVEAHGGDFNINSKKGVGTTISFTLPITEISELV